MTSGPYVAQPYDADLLAIAGLSGTGYLQRTGSATWSLGSPSSTPTAITVANEATDTTCFVGFFTAATGDLGPKTNTGLTFNSATGAFGVTGNITASGTLSANGLLTLGNAISFTGNAAVAGPSISGSSDGLLLVAGATNGVRINNSTNGSELFRVANNGNVTASGSISSGPLTAYSASDQYQLVASSSTGNIVAGVKFLVNNVNVGSIEGIATGPGYALVAGLNFTAPSGSDIGFRTGTITAPSVSSMIVKSSGSILMGSTTDNGARLQVTGNITASGTGTFQSTGTHTFGTTKTMTFTDGVFAVNSGGSVFSYNDTSRTPLGSQFQQSTSTGNIANLSFVPYATGFIDEQYSVGLFYAVKTNVRTIANGLAVYQVSLDTGSGLVNRLDVSGTGVAVTGNITASGSIKPGTKTIATLPSAASSTGERYQLSDSATIVNRVVFSNGSAWYYEGTAVAV